MRDRKRAERGNEREREGGRVCFKIDVTYVHIYMFTNFFNLKKKIK